MKESDVCIFYSSACSSQKCNNTVYVDDKMSAFMHDIIVSTRIKLNCDMYKLMVTKFDANKKY